MRKAVGLILVFVVLSMLLVPARSLRDFTPGNWRYLVAAGCALAVLFLGFGWIASRDRVRQSESPVARWLRHLTEDD
jgi:hypothetical protein